MLKLDPCAVGVTHTTAPMDTTPILCLPGVLGDAIVFEPLALLAQAQRRVYLADLPPGDPWRAAAILARRLETLGPFHVVTGSYGGLVCHKLPAHLVASAAHVATLPGPEHRDETQLLQGRGLRYLPARAVEALYARHLQRSLPADGLAPELVSSLLARVRSKSELLDRLQCVLDDELPERPAQRPTLWLLGEDDSQAPWTTAQILASQPDVEVAHIPGGHRPYATHPAPMLARLNAFWDKVESVK